MTTEEAINVLKLKFNDLLEGEYMWLWNKREHDLDLTPAEDGKAISEAIKALEVRQRLEEAIAKMEGSGTFAGNIIHYTKLKAILEGEKE